MNISAIILTYNESAHIEACLACLKFAHEIIVVDSGSIDNTTEIATQCGALVFTHSFENFSAQRNFAMSKAKGDWVLFIDADERVSDALSKEIQSVILQGDCAYAIPRHNYFFGRRLRYSGSMEDAPIRLFPKNSGEWKQPVHEYFETSLPVMKLKEPLIHHTTRDLAHYLEKVHRYVPLEVETMKERGRKVTWLDVVIRPPAKFIYLYFLKLGILDGWVGIQFAALSAYYDFKKYFLFKTVKHSLSL